MAGTEAELRESIKKTAIYLGKYFSIKEMILFGSCLSGKAQEWSDIDLAVISEDFKGKSFEEIVQTFAKLAVECTYKVEIHPFTPDDLKSARPTNFLGHIIANGKVAYQDGKFLI